MKTYLETERVDGWSCEHCKTTTTIEKRVQLQRLPQMLVLCSSYLGASSSHNVYPSRQFKVAQPAHNHEEAISTRYVLRSIVHHQGSSNAGHYVAFVRAGSSNEWYRCDDDYVCPVSWNEVNQGYGTAYLMLYQTLP